MVLSVQQVQRIQFDNGIWRKREARQRRTTARTTKHWDSQAVSRQDATNSPSDVVLRDSPAQESKSNRGAAKSSRSV